MPRVSPGLPKTDLSTPNPQGLSPARIGVVIVNWNGGELLTQVVRGLMGQTLRGFRLLIVDNGSLDGSLARATALCPWLEPLPQASNLGFAAANNLAVARLTDCDWIALLNPDAVPAPSWLEALSLAVSQHPDCAAFGSRQMQLHRPDIVDGLGDAYHVSGLPWRVGHGRPLGPGDQTTREIFSPCAAAALYRRDVFLATGGFDERFFCYLEDVDLAFRLRLAGHHCRYVPGAVVWHAGSGVTERLGDFALYHGHRNLVWTFVKDMPGRLLWRYLMWHLLMNLWAVVYFSLRGQGHAVLRSKWDALTALPQILADRRRVQEKRAATPQDILRMMQREWWPRRR
jgi:GT2 family glycosyltransferase